MAPITTAGAKLYIADPGTIVESPDPWTEVGGVMNYGEIARAWSEVRSNTVSRRTEKIYKGGRAAPTLTLEVEGDRADTGQIAMQAAYDDASQDDYNFKIELNDAPEGGTPTTATFKAKVLGWSGPSLGGLDNMVRRNALLGIDLTTFTEVDAAA